MRFLLFLLIPMLLVGGEFKVASYNIENLFDLQKNGSEYREYIPYQNGWDQAALDKKLNNIAQVICDLNADILALQEVENTNALNLLKQRLKRVGCEYRYHAIASQQNSAVKVALLSRFKITKSNEITIDRSHQSRSILQAKLSVEDRELTLFVNHWKSKHANGKESKRIRYAKALMHQIQKLPKGSEYIILGDFNSDYDEYETMEAKFNDTNGQTGINHILNTFVNDHLVDLVTLRSHPDRALHYNLWMEVSQSNRWSRRFYGRYSSIDSIIIPKNMLDSQSIEYKVDSFGIFKPAYLFQKRGNIYRWEMKHRKHTKQGYSDHLPIYATFMVGQSNPIKAKEKTPPLDASTIESLYQVESIKTPITIKNAKVILKRRNMAIIKQSYEGRGIAIYKETAKLDEGKSYDIDVERVDEYKGLKEITKIGAITPIGKCESIKFYKDATKGFDVEKLQQNEVYKNIVGIYKKRKLYIGDQKIDIYFKDKNAIPPNGSKIRIDFGHIGYYYQKQIVVYDSDDFSILEK